LIALLLFFWMYLKRVSFNRVDLWVLAAVFAAFGTELFYYFFVMKQVLFVSIEQLISEQLVPNSSFEWGTLPGVTESLYSCG